MDFLCNCKKRWDFCHFQVKESAELVENVLKMFHDCVLDQEKFALRFEQLDERVKKLEKVENGN